MNANNSWEAQQQRMLQQLISDKTKTLRKVSPERAIEIKQEIETLKKGLKHA